LLKSPNKSKHIETLLTVLLAGQADTRTS